MGRPSLIDRPIRERDDGTLITVSEAIINAMRAGSYFHVACRANGVHVDTGYGWREIAARLRLRAGGRSIEALVPAPTEHELRCLAFSEGVEDAEAQSELLVVGLIQQAARGGFKLPKIVTKKDADGNVTETTETLDTLPPNLTAMTWWLERRFPDRYGRRIEVTGADGGPVELSVAERANALADSLLEHQAASKANAANSRPRAPRKSQAKHKATT